MSTGPRLRLLDRVDLPVVEASGVATAQDADGTTYLAVVGDDSAEVAWSPVDSDAAADWTAVDLAGVDGWPFAGGQPSQFEAVAIDGERRLAVLCEEPAVVLVVDPAARAVTGTIRLVVGERSPLHEAWQDPSSRGEGMILLRDGLLLVAKEKRPPALLLFGPAGASARTIDRADLLGPGERWLAPQGDVEYHLLASWPVLDEAAAAVKDISDLALDADGGLWLLSDQSAALGLVGWPLEQGGSVDRFERTFRLPKKARKAEGVAWLPSGRAVVVMDQPTGRGAAWLVEDADEED